MTKQQSRALRYVSIIAILFGYGCFSQVEDPSATSTVGTEAIEAARNYVCGYALPGFGCNNGRNHAFVTASDMTSAIAGCQAAQLPGYTDFCYVVDADGTAATDESSCSAASASWRPGNSCCNFNGTKSCPAVRTYTCGYALPGFGCNNGRNHAVVAAADMTAAIAACHTAQLPGYTDFCYVVDSTGGTTADATECSDASASWRPGNSCCNFNGTTSCP
jgi:hypothetical protein